MLNEPAGQAAILAELARRKLIEFTTLTFPDFDVNWHHELICAYLDRFVAGEITRLIIDTPPRHGKSELVSRRLPAFLLGRYPDDPIIACSYSADLASLMNRDVQRIIDDPVYRRIFPDTELFSKNIRTVARGTFLRNSDIFEVVNRRGVYRSAGIRGGITGMGAKWAIIDDPVKSREEADSPTVRQRIWEWYASTLYPRLEKNASILVTMTRWHHADLVGMLRSLMKMDDQADKWVVLSLQAIAEEGTEEEPRDPGDPRAIGEALWPNKKSIEDLLQIKGAVGSREWNALYQQRPTPREGAMFQRAWFTFVNTVPADAVRVRYWDQAATAGAGDYTVGLLMAVKDGIYYVEDVVRGQWDIGERNAVRLAVSESDRSRYVHVRIVIEEEGGSAGKEASKSAVTALAGFSVDTERPTGSKENRAEPFASQASAGNVRIVRGVWNMAFIDELSEFPSGSHDDQVDAASGAFNQLCAPSFSFAVV